MFLRQFDHSKKENPMFRRTFTSTLSGMALAAALIPGSAFAQADVIRIVVPIGSDGVTPQRGCPPRRASAALSSSAVIDA